MFFFVLIKPKMSVINPGLGADLPMNAGNSSFFQGGICNKSLGPSLEQATAVQINWMPFSTTNKLLEQKYQAKLQAIKTIRATQKPMVSQRANYPGIL